MSKNIEICKAEEVGSQILDEQAKDISSVQERAKKYGIPLDAPSANTGIEELRALLSVFATKVMDVFDSFIADLQSTIASLNASITAYIAQIADINADIADAYDAVEDKGGTLPEQQTSANLPTAIESIPQGSGDEKVCDGTYTCNMSFEWHEGFENSITVIRGYIILGASSSNRTVINRDIEFKRLKQITGNNSIFRFVAMNGDLYLPELTQTNVSGEYGMVLSYASVRDIYLPKLRIGYIGFTAEYARNIYLGATKGGNIKIGYYGMASVNSLIFANGFGNSFDYKNLNRPKEELLDNINALYDFATDPLEGFTPILSIGSTNLAKLSDNEKAIATNKGWTLT